jgi:hypothetical protein
VSSDIKDDARRDTKAFRLPAFIAALGLVVLLTGATASLMLAVKGDDAASYGVWFASATLAVSLVVFGWNLLSESRGDILDLRLQLLAKLLEEHS